MGVPPRESPLLRSPHLLTLAPSTKHPELTCGNNRFTCVISDFVNTAVSLSQHSGFMGYGDLLGFISHNLFIINPCLDLWGYMGIYGKPEGDIKSPFMEIYGKVAGDINPPKSPYIRAWI